MQPFVHAEYVDNFIALSQERGVAHELATEVEQELNKRGLPTHPVESSVGGETLGWSFDSDRPHVTMTPRRLWKLKLAVDELLRQGWGSGQLVERIVGHCTFASLLRRELLSCFQAVYVFIRKRYHVHGRLWPEVVRELRWISSLLPLCHRNLGAEWSPSIFAVDASTWGRGVVTAKGDIDLVRQQAQHFDRWRFSINDENLVQKSLNVGGGCFGDILDFELANQRWPTSAIPEVDPVVLQLNWKKVNSAPWARPEAIPVLEGRALVWTVQHLARSQVNHNKRHLILSDSMTSILALSKGRGNSRSMNRICRQIASLTLACNFQLSYRWIASELNAADGPSRCRGVDFDFTAGLSSLLSGDVSEKSQSWRRQAADFYEKLYGPTGADAEARNLPCPRAGKDGQRQTVATSPRSSEKIWTTEDSDPIQCPEHNTAGVDDRVKHTEGDLCSGVGHLHAVCQDFSTQNSDLGTTGWSGSLVDRPPVLSGRKCRLSHDLHGGSEVLQKRCVPHVRLEPGDEGFQRFQEDCPGSGPSSSGLSDASSDSAAHPDPQAQAGCVSLAAPHLASVRTPGGSVQAPMETHGGAKPHQPFLVSSHVPVFGRGGGGHALQGGRNRRECDFECQLPSMDEPTAGALEDCSQRQRLCVSISAESRKQNLLGGCRRTWVSKQWRAMHIPDQTWGRINRSPLPWQSTGRCDEEGPLGNTSVREALRTGRQTRSGLRVVVQKGPKAVPRLRGPVGSANAHLRWLPQAPEGSLFLEIFSGSGNLSRAITALFHGNLTVVPIDLVHSADHDLEKRHAQQCVIEAIRQGKVAGVWLGTPSTSWSRARQNDGRGPPPLRSDSRLRGLPGLSLADQARVQSGNRLADFSALVFELCERMGVPVCLENPSTSRLWLLRRFKRLKNQNTVHFHLTDCCQDGQRRRMRTGLMSSNVDLSTCVRLCPSKRGICSRTGAGHVQLRGQQQRPFMTLRAQPYPTALCKRVAKAFEQAIFEYRARPYMQLLFP